MIKSIIFDFDGVITESADIKTNAFVELFNEFPQFKYEILDYHKKNMGISRFTKFKYFYESLFNLEYTDVIGNKLSKKFSEIVIQKIIEAPYVRGAYEFLLKYFDKYLCFIASGTPCEELKFICDQKAISKFFREIHGSPSTKDEIVDDILTKYSIKNNEAVFVGDAMSDYKAAMSTGTRFIGRVTDTDIFPTSIIKISDLSQLEQVLSDFD